MSFVYVGSLTSPTFNAEYRYAPDLSLATQVERTINNVVVRRTHYVGSLEWTDRNPGGTANREARLSLPGGLILVRKFIEGQLPVTNHRYMFFDALGSVDVIASETGAVIERMSFDLHGRRRSEADWTTPVTYGLDATTRRGYTGHEQVDGAGLIHMRARMYDPQLGRFIQPDPMVDTDVTQGWNRYSYVLNNPLSATDPTGLLTQRQAIRAVRTIAAIVVSVWMPQAGFWAGTAFQGFGAYIVSGFVAGGISGGWQGAIWGAFSAYTFRAVGASFPGAEEGTRFSKAIRTPEYWHKVLAHGTAGGVLTSLQGGKFGHGFVSNGVTEAASPNIQLLDETYEQAFAAALIGGSVSELTGGKFANGAMTSAFAWAFNHAVKKGGRRPLNQKELADGQGVFGDGIDWRKPAIWRKKYIFFQGEKYAMSPDGGNMYFGEAVYRDDFSGAMADRALLVHELAHVWQVQNNFSLNLTRQYDYSEVLRSGGGWEQMNTEEQAEVVTDLFLQMNGYRPQYGLPLGYSQQQLRALIPFSVPAYDYNGVAPWLRNW